VEFVERNLLKQPLSVEELNSLAARAGGIRELVKPSQRAEVEGLGDTEVARYLSENPNSVRRPIIDTGDMLTLGFTPAVRERLGGGTEPASSRPGAPASRGLPKRVDPGKKPNRGPPRAQLRGRRSTRGR